MQKLFLILGAVIIVIGLFWPLVSKMPLGKLPLDLSMRIGNTQVFIPIGTCILVSILISVLFRIFR
jgi:hypothetical protein